MNTEHLSTEELINYIDSGVITELKGEDFLRVVGEYKEWLKESFDEGYRVGYGDAESYWSAD